jgi:hypothetical protein
MKNMMRKICFAALLLLGSFCAFAQDDSEEEKESRFFAGGNFGLSIGRFTLINLNPQVGYRFNRYLSAGVGMNLLYTSLRQRDEFTQRDTRRVVQGIAGLNTFVRFFPTRGFMLQVQPEANYLFGKETFFQPVKQSFKLDAEIIPSLLAGGGIVAPAGRGVMLFTVMYDVLQHPSSPYAGRPVVQAGYNFSF